jgi:hypothetical protein
MKKSKKNRKIKVLTTNLSGVSYLILSIKKKK